MTNSTNTAYDDKLQALRRDYADRLRREGMELTALHELLQGGTISATDLRRVQKLAHGLAGTGSVFGHPDVSLAGAPLDNFAGDLLAQHVDDFPVGELRILGRMIETLYTACEDSLAQDTQPQTPRVPQSIAAGSYILLVDDDKDLAALLSSRLQNRGIHVVIATDGTEAMRLISEQTPDLVILDVMMPGLSGHDVLRKLKYDPQLSLIPVVMLSGITAESEAETAKRLGAVDYIAKPFEAETLIARLEKILDASRFHVALIDNDDMLLDLLREKFQQRGFQVSTQNDGKDAWDFILKALPDLVILDRMMPGMDGLAVLKNIRTEEATKDIPVIVLSARKEERDVKIGLQFGAQEYVTKPCDPEDLLNRSLELLHDRGSEKISQRN